MTATTFAEQNRLTEAREQSVPWKKWGPYLSERQWGTVREDYSKDGNAWNYFTHDHARSRAYRWGEDGLAGICDDQQRLCFALALWNGADPILKERLFGLANSEGNHGEDVKEYYYYLDSTPTHSYMRYLYKYPQRAFPYADLVETNARRGRLEPEYELIDTGVFNENRYFDVVVEYAKASPEDLLIKITVCNRGPTAADLHLLPTLWFRNTWSWSESEGKPQLNAVDAAAVEATHADLGVRFLHCEDAPDLLFTENETNAARIFGKTNPTPYVKDSINDAIVAGHSGVTNPGRVGTKAAAHYRLTVPAGGETVVRLRLNEVAPAATKTTFGKAFEATLTARRADADAFYASITPDTMSADEALVMRQALAGMLWTKQYFYYDVGQWLEERGVDARRDRKTPMRNREWSHMVNADIISMPDKWEYPWYAAWDLAFHTIPLAMVDPDFAKEQLDLMLRENYLHPNGQIPAYEWNFSDVNPPVHAFSAWFVYELDRRARGGDSDRAFLKEVFRKLLLNFTWWVNRKDIEGNNLFGGGFLGLDNIGVFDRSSPLPTGGHLEQADGTAWMAFFSAMMMRIAIELALDDPTYESMAVKFADHYFRIAGAMDRIGDHNDELWDEEDGFFYDVLHFPDGGATRLKVRSMVGLLPLFATAVFPSEAIEKLPRFVEGIKRVLGKETDLIANIHPPAAEGYQKRHLLCLFSEQKLRRVLAYMLDEDEFLSPYGIRALSRYYQDHPYVFHWGGQEFKVAYVPGDSDTGMFGGNSNWRGPIWMPVNIMLIKALLSIYQYAGDDFKVECPTGSGKLMNMFEVAKEISNRLANIFKRDAHGRRPVFGTNETFQNNPHWRDHILFYEYFHGDSGAGIGASHQTGWTGCVAKLMQLFASVSAEEMLKNLGTAGLFYTEAP
ncbi:MAG: glucosidase [Rhodospirillales bacterium]|nr:glucosidase [Rhodospirillales bacterium]